MTPSPHALAALALVLLMTVAPPVTAKCHAGMVLYFTTATEVYLLLGDHLSAKQQQRGWDTFGGSCEGYSLLQTATRETFEETRGYFHPRQLEQWIGNQTPVESDNRHYYFVEIPYFPVQRLNNQQPPQKGKTHYERGPYAWVPLSLLTQHFNTPLTKRGRDYTFPSEWLPKKRASEWVYPPLIKLLQQTQQQGRLPVTPGIRRSSL